MREKPLFSQAPARVRAYLDYNASAPLRAVARRAMEDCLRLLQRGGNPSSPHAAGRAARVALEEARERVAAIIGARPLEIVFTSGGTESNNMAVRGWECLPLVVSAIEHPSILRLAECLRASGTREVRIVPVDESGRIGAGDLARSVGGRPCLACICLANNEVGTIQEMEELAPIVRRQGGKLHIDAVQAAGRIALDVDRLEADSLSLSGHKVGGPPGVGVLYVRKGSGFCASQVGGGQEGGLRAGTENVVGAVGLAAALEEAECEREVQGERLERLREKLWRGIERMPLRARRNSPETGSLANTLNVSFPGLDGASLAAALDLEGVAVSTGSACAAGAGEPSHVLRAMARSAAEVRGAIRFSMGGGTTEPEVDYALRVLAGLVERAGKCRGSALEGGIDGG